MRKIILPKVDVKATKVGKRIKVTVKFGAKSTSKWI